MAILLRGLLARAAIAVGGEDRYIPGRFRRVRAMKEGIHPDYHEITILMTDGTSYPTRSTYGKAGDTLRLEIDPKSHPAWTGGQQRLLDTGGQLARFNRRFQGFGRKS
jgi:large subunit ribosomal protein L31